MAFPLFNRTLLAAGLCAAVLAFPVSAERGQGRPDRPNPSGSGSGLILHTSVGYAGASRTIPADLPNFNALNFNDQARSAEVQSGVWLLCSDAGLRGRCEYVDANVSNLADIGLSGNISSARLTDYSKGPRGYDISLFANRDLNGPFLGFDDGIPDLSQFRFNDTASSILITRGTWLLCEDADYQGDCEFVDARVDDLGEIGFNDRISSFRRYDVRREGRWHRRVTDYTTGHDRPVARSLGHAGSRRNETGIRGEQTMFFPVPLDRGQRIANGTGAATEFCRDQGFSEAVYKSSGRLLSDVLCR